MSATSTMPGFAGVTINQTVAHSQMVANSLSLSGGHRGSVSWNQSAGTLLLGSMSAGGSSGSLSSGFYSLGGNGFMSTKFGISVGGGFQALGSVSQGGGIMHCAGGIVVNSGGSFFRSGGLANIGGTVSIRGMGRMSNGTTSVGADFAVNGTSGAGTFSVEGGLLGVAGHLQMESGILIQSGGTIAIDGNVNLQQSAGRVTQTGGSFVAGGDLNINDSSQCVYR